MEKSCIEAPWECVEKGANVPSLRTPHIELAEFESLTVEVYEQAVALCRHFDQTLDQIENTDFEAFGPGSEIAKRWAKGLIERVEEAWGSVLNLRWHLEESTVDMALDRLTKSGNCLTTR